MSFALNISMIELETTKERKACDKLLPEYSFSRKSNI